ncbi:hypothetical protein SeLEV6574_g00963 [Synchytrium endobioticum]|uniref:Uncharacterized protein n=1 Tax=Synchytrium endobioticum TaxID=286115 RepID=A0A507DF78_9FUNG|nr:hypothetical protein SeLEV6574_g00963 [Synchytrium endobioticum]
MKIHQLQYFVVAKLGRKYKSLLTLRPRSARGCTFKLSNDRHLSKNINEMIKKLAKAAVSSMRTSSPMTSPSPLVDVSKMLLQQTSELRPYTVPY